jgi:alpha-tubulin suppressor-like RCC1 family protein
VRALALVLMAAIGGCTPIEHAFRCAESGACVREGVAGTCEATHWCAFPDAACASGRRYGELAGDGLSGACVTAADSCGAIGEPCCAGSNACQGKLACTRGVCVGCVAALALGDGHGCALAAADGSVACWGKNDHGQLGNGGTGDAAAAVAVVDDHGKPITGVTAIAAGAAHTCALRADKTVLCWGDDSAGQLGHGGSASVNPVPAPAALTSIAGIAAGGRHSCAALDDGSVWCWGANDAGQLGTAPSVGASMPMEVVDRAGAPLGAASLAAGTTHSCAVGRDAKLVCWGSDVDGELGDGSTAATSLPVAAAALGAHVTAAAGGAHFGCALRDDGAVACFGLDDRGQSGQPPGATVAVPTAVPSVDLATAVATGGALACTRRAGARMLCWGDGAGVVAVREGVGPIAVGAGDACSARADGIDCRTFGDPHLACP